MKKNMMRQGDVLVVKIGKLPADVVPHNNQVLAEGEATGHAHRLDETCEVYEKKGTLYFKVPEGKTGVLSHEEHGKLNLQEGTYKVVRQREYLPTEWKRWAYVRD